MDGSILLGFEVCHLIHVLLSRIIPCLQPALGPRKQRSSPWGPGAGGTRTALTRTFPLHGRKPYGQDQRLASVLGTPASKHKHLRCHMWLQGPWPPPLWHPPHPPESVDPSWQVTTLVHGMSNGSKGHTSRNWTPTCPPQDPHNGWQAASEGCESSR